MFTVCVETVECVVSRWGETEEGIVRLQNQATVGILTACFHQHRSRS